VALVSDRGCGYCHWPQVAPELITDVGVLLLPAYRCSPMKRDQQFASIRRIYGPEKEASGVLAIEIELAAELPT
jgi:hypothetical protein